MMAQTEARPELSGSVEKLQNETPSPAQDSSEVKVGPKDGESSAPEIPPKSPLRASRFKGKKSGQEDIPEHIVLRTQGRVKQLTAELEEKKNIYLKLWDWQGDYDEPNKEPGSPGSSS